GEHQPAGELREAVFIREQGSRQQEEEQAGQEFAEPADQLGLDWCRRATGNERGAGDQDKSDQRQTSGADGQAPAAEGDSGQDGRKGGDENGVDERQLGAGQGDRKSTRLNSS